MKTLFVTRNATQEKRESPVIPSDAQRLSKIGWEVKVESGAGVKAGFSDEDYKTAGASIVDGNFAKEADFIVAVRKPTVEKSGILRRARSI